MAAERDNRLAGYWPLNIGMLTLYTQSSYWIDVFQAS